MGQRNRTFRRFANIDPRTGRVSEGWWSKQAEIKASKGAKEIVKGGTLIDKIVHPELGSYPVECDVERIDGIFETLIDAEDDSNESVEAT